MCDGKRVFIETNVIAKSNNQNNPDAPRSPEDLLREAETTKAERDVFKPLPATRPVYSRETLLTLVSRDITRLKEMRREMEEMMVNLELAEMTLESTRDYLKSQK